MKPEAKPVQHPKPRPQPKPCLLAVGYEQEPLTYRYQAVGLFPSKAEAKRRLAELTAETPDLLFLILESEPRKGERAAVYGKLAADLEGRP
ncbi:hypothetical protein HMPREF3107_00280 [Neisseria sp. HMSC31F04]|jgi:hypothetical protein|uniref:hypothetical protein n=1 Tax=Neisseria sp. HMSC31F04 TaxID=1581075 RepID=UPI0008A3705A|nr:hypothetical protein [Neisseria sp. HMSC31F04]OFT04463.1 hypothetical protein HMPREF3107_00280 [Neisseria sp. HMSC31F04]DAX34476.1 MAG TPA: hypothetical protein [Caudoviricetes sp.]